MDFIERVTGMFTKPEETVNDILGQPRIEESLLIVGIYAVLAVISTSLSSLHNGTGISIISAVITLVLTLVGWAIATGVVHALALFLGGQGKYHPQMLNVIGYTYIVKYIPLIIGMVLIFLMPVISVPSQPTVTASMTTDQIKTVMQPYLSMMSQMYFNPIFILSMVISYLGLIWSCFLGSIAVKNGDKVSRTASYIAVFVPMVVYILVYTLMIYGSYLLLNAMYG